MNSELTNNKIITHLGTITEINNKSIIVSIDDKIHCEACHAKGACNISNQPNKELTIANTSSNFNLHEKVTIVLNQKLGLNAVFWAYVLPFILMLSVLVIISAFYEEWIAGIAAILVLIPYYLLLYVLKSQFQKAFQIAIKKYN